MGIGRFAFTPVWPLMAHDAALSLEQGGWLASANYAGYLLGALIAAAWPPRRPLAALGASLLAVAALTLAMPLPHSVAGWAALRLAAGWASALGFICVASWRPARAGDPIEPAASAVVYAGVGAGIAATGLACLALMAAGATAAQCWMALGALALALSMAAWPRLRGRCRPPPRPPAHPTGNRCRAAWRDWRCTTACSASATSFPPPSCPPWRTSCPIRRCSAGPGPCSDWPPRCPA